eukprot:TRINITY_DN3697_c0_g2_i1.p1 TRINITY_DN3697_c0_g2~~TRINITY_DN3697_c0_g2_i1.p1  ORF type:complete len:159 (-),score=12.50 TRINITY_DN3697_c0_g2_i1:29-505(-)
MEEDEFYNKQELPFANTPCCVFCSDLSDKLEDNCCFSNYCFCYQDCNTINSIKFLYDKERSNIPLYIGCCCCNILVILVAMFIDLILILLTIFVFMPVLILLTVIQAISTCIAVFSVKCVNLFTCGNSETFFYYCFLEFFSKIEFCDKWCCDVQHENK